MSNEVQIHYQADTAVDAIKRFESSLFALIGAHGLPSDGVLVEVDERAVLLGNLTAGMSKLPFEERSESLYLSKMVAAAASGLFDAALNYLWNETIAELRKRAARYDLNFFFDVAVKHQEKRKDFKTEEDLQLLQDYDLLSACLSIGLLSDIGHRKLNHIRDMRNHSSAAHPNHTEITGLELAAFLRQCIDYVIVLELPHGTVEIGTLLARIKTLAFTADQATKTATFFSQLPSAQAEALAKGLFGINLDKSSTARTRDNVRLLWPELWTQLGSDAKYVFGTRIATFLANGDHESAELAHEIFDLGAGSGAFLPDSVRIPELNDAIDAVRTAHQGWDNFSNEFAPARRLANLIGEVGTIPEAVSRPLVIAVVEAYLGNPYGVSLAAVPSYKAIISTFGRKEALTALTSFTDPDIQAALEDNKPRQRWNSLIEMLGPKLSSTPASSLYDAVHAFSSTPDRLGSDAKIKKLMKAALD